MNHQIFFLIRFSINLKWKLGEENKKKWNTEEIDYRFKLFETFCLPSLLAQTTLDNTDIILIISEDFPIDFQDRLRDIIKDYSFIHIEYFTGTLKRGYIDKYIKPETEIIATIRYDDDDVLQTSYIEKLKQYLVKKNIGKYLTFPNGYFIELKKNIRMFKSHSPFIAVGLAYISLPNSSQLAYYHKHLQIPNLCGYVIDKSPDMWVVVNHKHGLEGRFRTQNYSKNLTIEVINKFNFINFNNI